MTNVLMDLWFEVVDSLANFLGSVRAALWFTGYGIILRLLLGFVLGLALFAFAAGFGTRQALVVSLVFALLICDHFPPKPRPSKWRPYWISFHPNFALMLSAIGFLDNPEQWIELLAQRDPPPTPDRDVEKHSFFHYLALAEPTKESERLFVVSHGGYSTDITTSYPLLAATFPDAPKELKYSDLWRRSYCPEFFISRTANGYSFGLSVRENWWRASQTEKPHVRDSVIEEYARGRDIEFGLIHLVMGRLPIHEICYGYYYRFQNSEPIRQQIMREKELSAKIAEFGWSQVKLADGQILTHSFQHRFMRIEHGLL